MVDSPGHASGSRGPRWELLRALGAALVTPPPHNDAMLEALGLPAQSGAEHTGVFVLGAPPHAAIYLGPEGKLGGVGLDRVAGYWRVLGLQPPEDADHLGVLLMLYAELGEAEDNAGAEATRTALARVRSVLFDEHIASWAPAYLAAAHTHTAPAVAAWVQLTAEALRAEATHLRVGELPAALRDAPAPLDPSADPASMLDALVAPVRSGFVLTWPDVERCGAQTGLGVRRGERRYALKAYLEQDPRLTLDWLASHARSWTERHAAAFPDPLIASWWQDRARHTARTLDALNQPTMAGRS